MRTEDAQADAAKVRLLATERGLSACMNDTKWREVCELFRHWSAPPPRFRISDLLAPDGYVSEWDREWYYHPRPYVSIQWLEVEIPSDSVPAALARCKEIGASVEARDVGLRVWGWVGPANRPQFA
jgi:FAD/FMN-containing dehydrogenase